MPPVPVGTSGFPTEGDQWCIVNALGASGSLTVPAGGPAPVFTPGQTGNLNVMFPIPPPAPGMTLAIVFDWNYVSPECANDPTYNDFLDISLTDGAGTIFQNLIYRDTYSTTLGAPATTPEETGIVTAGFCNPPGTLEEMPIGAPKTAVINIDPTLLGMNNIFFEVNVGDGADAAYSSYAYIDNLTIISVPILPTITMSSPAPGQTLIVDTNLAVGVDTFNVFNFEICPGGPGSGPAMFYGFCLTSPTSINNVIQQLLLPAFAGNPFHYISTNGAETLGPFAVQPGLTLDAICIQIGFGGLVNAGPVINYTTQ
ncbi:MAG: hypothetical protein CMJ83_17720 [Planctomycetes bacterium]|nr:hypothetical protein [Planctomycetota bacterium]